MVLAVYLMAILFGCPSAMVVLLCLMLKRVGNYDTGACSAVHQVAFGLAHSPGKSWACVFRCKAYRFFLQAPL